MRDIIIKKNINIILIFILLLFVGCSKKNQEIPLYNNYYINDTFKIKKIEPNESMIEKMDKLDKTFFQPNISSLKYNSELTNQDIEKFLPKNQIYNNILDVYKNITENHTISVAEFTLKGSDYITLYKMLYINHPHLFKKEKSNIINGFIFQIQDYYNLDFKYIKKILYKENFTKIKTLKDKIIKLEKENNV